MNAPILLWFRRDLRLNDNPALTSALTTGAAIIPVFIDDQQEAGDHAEGAASRWWLEKSLQRLSDRIHRQGGTFIRRSGDALPCLRNILEETGAESVFWNRRYEPWCVDRDKRVKTALSENGVLCKSFASDMLAEPWRLKTGAGAPYSVFTPYWRAFLKGSPPEAPLPTPEIIRWMNGVSKKKSAHEGPKPLNAPQWAAKFNDMWRPGEEGAIDAATSFFESGANDYKHGRDRPAAASVSRLSPHLHFGEISTRRLWRLGQAALEEGDVPADQVNAFLRQLGWRDFNRALLFNNPTLTEEAFRPAFDAFPWTDDGPAYKAWTRGETGYPFVDAGMRELWATGYMHNRVRMVVASFLVKHLLIDWRRGEKWFRDTLLDADLANNVGGWQWAAGCGADAAPYFRIFNPITQGEKFDPDGEYTRKWVPELARLSNAFLFKPWEAPPLELKAAGVALGKTYPERLVEHGAARNRALLAYEKVKQKAA